MQGTKESNMQVTTDIPLPPKRAEYRPQVYWPFATMEVGASFAVRDEDAFRCSTSANRYKQQNPGWNYTRRREGNQTRFWRTA